MQVGAQAGRRPHLAADVLDAGGCQERRGGGEGAEAQHGIGGRLGGQRDARERVHDHVDPQHLHRRERALAHGEHAPHRHRDRRDVDRQLKLHTAARPSAGGRNSRRRRLTRAHELGTATPRS